MTENEVLAYNVKDEWHVITVDGKEYPMRIVEWSDQVVSAEIYDGVNTIRKTMTLSAEQAMKTVKVEN